MLNQKVVYIKAAKKVVIEEKEKITIGDLADVNGNPKLAQAVKNLVVIKIKDKKKQNQLISIIDIIEIINKHNPEIIVTSVGEPDIILSYSPVKQKERKWLTKLKIVFVGLTLFFGAFIAIMTFHTDAAVPDVFIVINEIFTGKYERRPYYLIIPYSIGLAVGIIVFFNHFSQKKLTDDPTPIEVEFRSYERSVEDCIIESLISEKREDTND